MRIELSGDQLAAVVADEKRDLETSVKVSKLRAERWVLLAARAELTTSGRNSKECQTIDTRLKAINRDLFRITQNPIYAPFH